MLLLVLLVIAAVVLFGVGATAHALLWVAIVALLLAIILAVVRRPWTGDRRYWW